MPTTTSDAATLVVADTCSLLDLARSAARSETLSDEVANARRIWALAKAGGNALAIGVCDVTHTEFENNISNVLDGARAQLNELYKRVVHANQVAVHLGLAPILTNLPSKTEWTGQVVSQGEQTARSLLAFAEPIPTTVDRDRAFKRSAERRPPAKQGSSASMFDCIITECCLRVAAGRPLHSTWFVTSNKSDFYPEGSVPPDLAADFASAGLKLARSWTDLVARLNA